MANYSVEVRALPLQLFSCIFLSLPGIQEGFFVALYQRQRPSYAGMEIIGQTYSNGLTTNSSSAI
jgi:hypothetical protein